MTDLFELRPGRYRHFKGNEYELLYVARHSETLEPMVANHTENSEEDCFFTHCGVKR